MYVNYQNDRKSLGYPCLKDEKSIENIEDFVKYGPTMIAISLRIWNSSTLDHSDLSQTINNIYISNQQPSITKPVNSVVLVDKIESSYLVGKENSGILLDNKTKLKVNVDRTLVNESLVDRNLNFSETDLVKLLEAKNRDYSPGITMIRLSNNIISIQNKIQSNHTDHNTEEVLDTALIKSVQRKSSQQPETNNYGEQAPDIGLVESMQDKNSIQRHNFRYKSLNKQLDRILDRILKNTLCNEYFLRFGAQLEKPLHPSLRSIQVVPTDQKPVSAAIKAKKMDPGKVTRVRILSINSAVLFPGRTPGIKPPCFFILSATSTGLKAIAV